jgi:hypothetical protein
MNKQNVGLVEMTESEGGEWVGLNTTFFIVICGMLEV